MISRCLKIIVEVGLPSCCYLSLGSACTENLLGRLMRRFVWVLVAGSSHHACFDRFGGGSFDQCPASCNSRNINNCDRQTVDDTQSDRPTHSRTSRKRRRWKGQVKY